MDTNSLLVLIIALLTLNLLFVGIYIVLVLKEVRESVRRFNFILDQVGKVSESISAPIVGASGALLGFMEGRKFFRKLRAQHLRAKAEEGYKPSAVPSAQSGKEVKNE